MAKKKRIPEKEALRRMLKSGMSAKEIAEACGATRGDVKGWIKLAGLEKEWKENRRKREEAKMPEDASGRASAGLPDPDKEGRGIKAASKAHTSIDAGHKMAALSESICANGKTREGADGASEEGKAKRQDAPAFPAITIISCRDLAENEAAVEDVAADGNSATEGPEKSAQEPADGKNTEGPLDIKDATKEVLERLYVAENRTSAELAEMFGIQPQAMRMRLQRMGLRKQASHKKESTGNGRKKPETKKPAKKAIPDRTMLRRLYVTENLTAAQIAARYGVTGPTVYGWLRKENITRQTARRGQAYPGADAIIATMENGSGAEDIAREYNIAVQTARGWIRKAKEGQNT